MCNGRWRVGDEKLPQESDEVVGEAFQEDRTQFIKISLIVMSMCLRI